MARPSYNTITVGTANWDAPLNDNFEVILGAPFPPVQISTLAGLNSNFDPADYENCIATAGDEPGYLFVSDGTEWRRVPYSAEAMANVVGWADATAQSDFNALLTKLRASGVIET